MQVLLGSGFLKGVKTAMAERIAHTFGAQTFARLDEALDNPDRLQMVKGIGPKNCLWIVESWRVQRHWANAALVSVRAGLTMRQAREAYRTLRRATGQGCRRQSLPAHGAVSGVTWQRADEIAALEWPGKAKIDHDDARRYGAAVREVLREAYSQGHMALAETDALARAKQLARPTPGRLRAEGAGALRPGLPAPPRRLAVPGTLLRDRAGDCGRHRPDASEPWHAGGRLGCHRETIWTSTPTSPFRLTRWRRCGWRWPTGWW
ncbi:MAG: hypothetical protein V9H69_18340 [Anaerolineae bacterium]